MPAPMPSAFDTVQGVAVPMAQFMELTRIPIVIYLRRQHPGAADDMPAQDSWRVRLADGPAVARHGQQAWRRRHRRASAGDRHRGNTHFLFSDLNNVQIADLVSKFLTEKRLDSK